MDGVTPGLTTGTSTDAISGEHLILTAGGMDTHVHYISPQQVYAALSNGITTLWGGGIGPGRRHERRHHDQRAVEPRDDAARRSRGCRSISASTARAIRRGAARWSSSCKAGAAGFKVHEDYGSTPSAIRAALTRRRRFRRLGGRSHRHAQRGRLRRGHDRRLRRPHRSTPITARAPAAAMRRTC